MEIFIDKTHVSKNSWRIFNFIGKTPVGDNKQAVDKYLKKLPVYSSFEKLKTTNPVNILMD